MIANLRDLLRRGGRRRGRESEKDCLRREIREELPKLKLGRLKLWKEVKAKNPRSGRNMSDAIFIANKVSGPLVIGDKREIEKATWRKPRGVRLTPTSRYIRDKLFPKAQADNLTRTDKNSGRFLGGVVV